MCEAGNPRRRWLVPFFVSLIFTSGIEEVAEAIRELQGCIAKHETPVITSVVPFQYSTNFKGPSARRNSDLDSLPALLPKLGPQVSKALAAM